MDQAFTDEFSTLFTVCLLFFLLSNLSTRSIQQTLQTRGFCEGPYKQSYACRGGITRLPILRRICENHEYASSAKPKAKNYLLFGIWRQHGQSSL